MDKKKQKIKIVYEEIEITEYYFVKSFDFDKFELRNRFLIRENKYKN